MHTLLKTTPRCKIVAITTGDPNGIGYEVTAKALCSYEFKKLYKKNYSHCALVVYKSSFAKQKKYDLLLKKHWLVTEFSSLEDCLSFLKVFKFLKTQDFLFIINSSNSAANWVIEASKNCLKKEISSLVTGPLSKTLIQKSGYTAIGHTGLFKMLLPKSNLFMGFVGTKFNVLLATDHISLSQVEKTLTKRKISNACKASLHFRKMLQSKKTNCIHRLKSPFRRKNIIGRFESKNSFPGHSGPQVPDAAFLIKNWNKYSHYLCMYHDQGLIPFKMIHGQDSGVHITIGLPFIRTSVDHGTAFDLFNKDLANCSSMKDAILFNLKLIKGK